jgi:lipopolysaccharide biosynthesis glycosyltransferase
VRDEDLIAIVGDDRYAVPVNALMHSIAATWRGAFLPRVRVLGPQWRQPQWRLLEQASRAAGIVLSFHRHEHDMRMPVVPPWTRTVYSRIRLGDSCRDARRVLCLDADMIVLSSLHLLLDHDLGGYAVGAVSDICIEAQRSAYGAPVRYLNAGLLLVDTERWIAQEVGDRCEQQLLRFGEDLRYFDQDALNLALGQDWLALDQLWNVFHFTEIAQSKALPKRLTDPEEHQRLKVLEQRARILHYVGQLKPWHKDYPAGANLTRFEQHDRYCRLVDGWDRRD